MEMHPPRRAAFVPKVRQVGFFPSSDHHQLDTAFPSSPSPLSELAPEIFRSPVMILPTRQVHFLPCSPDLDFSDEVWRMAQLLEAKTGNLGFSPTAGKSDSVLMKPNASSIRSLSTAKVVNGMTGMKICVF